MITYWPFVIWINSFLPVQCLVQPAIWMINSLFSGKLLPIKKERYAPLHRIKMPTLSLVQDDDMSEEIWLCWWKAYADGCIRDRWVLNMLTTEPNNPCLNIFLNQKSFTGILDLVVASELVNAIMFVDQFKKEAVQGGHNFWVTM